MPHLHFKKKIINRYYLESHTKPRSGTSCIAFGSDGSSTHTNHRKNIKNTCNDLLRPDKSLCIGMNIEFIPSNTVVNIKKKYKHKMNQIIVDYYNLPDLPYNNILEITNIGSYNPCLVQNAPIIIFSYDKSYKTNPEYWWYLNKIIDNILIKQTIKQQNILPIKLVIDKEYTFIKVLQNYINHF